MLKGMLPGETKADPHCKLIRSNSGI